MIKFGLIGAGPNGAGNVRKLTKFKDRCQLVAIADPNQEAAKALADELGAEHVLSDYTDLFDKVDAVVISSPNWLHTEQAIACAEAGLHVWIEKPMALTVEDADKICAAVDKAGVKSFVGFSVRFGASPRTIKLAQAAGDIGDVRSIWSRRLCNLFKDGKSGWRADFTKSGGVMAELLAHEVDWMIDIAGDPETVMCRIQADNASHEMDNDHVWMTFGFNNGVTGTIEGSQNSLIADYYKGIVGDKGSVHDRSWGGDVFLNTADGDKQLDTDNALNKHEHFLDVLEGKTDSIADVHHGRKIVYISEKALQSAVNGTIETLEGVSHAHSH